MAAEKLNTWTNGVFIILNMLNEFIASLNGDILPMSTSTGLRETQTHALGTSTYGFRDLYLSADFELGKDTHNNRIVKDSDGLHFHKGGEPRLSVGAGRFSKTTDGSNPGKGGISTNTTFSFASDEFENTTSLRVGLGTIFFTFTDDGSNDSYFEVVGEPVANLGADIRVTSRGRFRIIAEPPSPSDIILQVPPCCFSQLADINIQDSIQLLSETNTVEATGGQNFKSIMTEIT